MKRKSSILIDYRVTGFILIFFIFAVLLSGCFISKGTEDRSSSRVPWEERWGIYLLDSKTQKLSLVYSSREKIDYLHLSSDGTRFSFSKFIGGNELENAEICVLDVDGSGCRQPAVVSFWCQRFRASSRSMLSI